MNSIFTSPDEIVISILAEWSDPKTITVLDSACCNVMARDQFFCLLGHKYLTVTMMNTQSNMKNKTSRLFIKWIIQRHIKLSTLILDEQVLATIVDLSYDIDLTLVKEMMIYDCSVKNIDSFLKVISSCTTLLSLILILTDNITDGLFDKLGNLHQLEIIESFGKSEKLTPLILQILANKCNRLQEVSLTFATRQLDSFFGNTICADYLVYFLQRNQRLRKLHLFIEDFPGNDLYNLLDGVPVVDVMELILNTCPDLVDFELSCLGKLNVSYFAKFVSNSKKLRRITVTKEQYGFVREIRFIAGEFIKTVSCRNFFDPQNNIDKTTDNIKHLFESVVGLTRIELNQIYFMSDDFLNRIINRNYATLNQLTIGVCEHRSWSHLVIKTLLIKCKSLSTLQLLDCSHFTNANFVELMLLSHRLSELRIDNAINLWSTILLMLVFSSKCLLKLSIENCPNVDELVLYCFCEADKPSLVFEYV